MLASKVCSALRYGCAVDLYFSLPCLWTWEVSLDENSVPLCLGRCNTPGSKCTVPLCLGLQYSLGLSVQPLGLCVQCPKV